MKIIYPKNRIMLFVFIIAIGVLSTTAYADRVRDGPVEVKIENNNLCFSVNSYKPRGYFIKKIKIGSQGLAVRNVGFAEYQRGLVWGQSLPFEKHGSEFILKPNQCVPYGTLLRNYNLRGNVPNLYSGKYSVTILGYDPAADKNAIFKSVFSIDVINGKVTLKSVD